jgi:hypothetical protein
MVIGEEPSTVKPVHDTVPEHVAEVVAAPYTPAAPFDTRRLLELGCEVVASPENENAPVELLYWSGVAAESDERMM